MGMMSIETELNREIEEIVRTDRNRIAEIGRKAVEVAKENGTYHNVTGRLRASNGFKMDKDKAVLYNSAPYAEEVSARGHDVLDSAIKYFDEEISRL